MATESPASPKAPRKPRAPKAAAPVAASDLPEAAAAPKKKAAAPRKTAAKKTVAPVVEASTPESPVTATEPAMSTEERIRIAAYRRYEARGFVEGDPLVDWVEAEREVSRSHA